MNMLKRLAKGWVPLVIILGSLPAEAEEPPLRIHMISGSKEYESEPSLSALKSYLEKHYHVNCTLSLGSDGFRKDLPGIEALQQADVMLVFCRRVKPPEEQLELIKKWCAEGKPVVGIRTASHAFQGWLEFDKEVLGGDYRGHSGSEQVQVSIEDQARDHPILAGVKEWTRQGKFYHNPNLAEDVTLLLTGTSRSEKQPLAWARTYQKHNGGRSFYTSMGLPQDFENENFKRLLANAISWTAKRSIERR